MNMHVKAAKVELKAGDRVRVTHTDYPHIIPVGAIVEIVRINRDGDAHLAENDNDKDGLYFFAHEFLPAPLYAVGDKVRALVGGFDITAGKVYEVDDAVVDGVYIIDDEGDRNWLNLSELEPYTEQPAAPKFKVGDRVRAIKTSGGYTKGNVYVVKRITDYGIKTVTDDKGSSTNGWTFDAFELAPLPATLTIQAGRYYKTRDGRKVGPMERVGGYLTAGGWHYNVSGECCYRGKSGETVQPHLDLIAEWPAEPVVAPATTAKFKVGDSIRVIKDGDEDGGSYHSAKIGDEFEVTDVDEGSETEIHTIRWYFYPHEIELVVQPSSPAIVCLIENGQPLPSTRPYIHLNRGAAEAEAGRLAGVHKGSEFGVYELVTVKKVERTYEHEWQRLATDKSIPPWRVEKVAAAELAKQSGIPIFSAEKAVKDWLLRAA